MFYANYINEYGEEHSDVFYSWPLFFTATVSPDTKIKTIIDFKISGKTYQQRKNAARALAIEFQTKQRPGLSWLEIADIQHFFTKCANRYGLRREFSENGVI